MDDAPRLQREVGAPVESVEHLNDRQAEHRHLRIGPELHRAGPAPAFVHDHVGEAPRGELTDGGASVDMVDGLEVDVLGEVEMLREGRERIAPLLVGHGAGDHVDAVPLDDADD